MSNQRPWPADIAQRIADKLVADLAPSCQQVCIAGSLRRGKPLVSDVEVLYVPRFGRVRMRGELFPRSGSLADELIEQWLTKGVLRKRLNPMGVPSWGDRNKLAVHIASGIPVDLFATTTESWFVALVVQTGSKKMVTTLTTAASRRGMQLHAYGVLEVTATGEQISPQSEREVFQRLRVPYRAPAAR